ncbi:cell division protein FtsA [Carboxydothermus ferrireducens]|uniref:Cell division protein FtsA n=1 Tax=Carboxydothermus ferrireducens DSM 11255 TaxID=1119529 RepID=A0ABX2RC58_9THEO|nr:cell division protein FtsA [Carboxydothermus ferrireducens]NYE58776.1 cell division protein FtsA [Carboxydothermus ferrireducens DSM 11255]
MAKKELIAVVDVGSSKIVALIGEIAADGQVTLLGVGETASSGIKKGAIVDIDGTVKAIKTSLEKAEQIVGYGLTSAVVSFTSPSLISLNNKSVVAVTNLEREITSEDVNRVLNATKIVPIPPDKKIIKAIPRFYTVDGFAGVVDPVGMTGSRLEAETHIIAVAQSTFANLQKVASKAGLNVLEFIPAILASAEVVLYPAEKELGCLLIDIGAGTMDLAIYSEGSLFFTGAIPVGDQYITNDLAIGLRTPIAVAEKIKIEAGTALASLVQNDEYLEVENVGGTEKQKVSKQMVAAIIEARVREMLELALKEIRSSGFTGLLPGGVIITGGGAMLPGIKEVAQEIFDLPVRIGVPEGLSNLPVNLINPRYASAIGALVLAAKQYREEPEESSGIDFLSGLFQKIKAFFSELF